MIGSMDLIFICYYFSQTTHMCGNWKWIRCSNYILSHFVGYDSFSHVRCTCSDIAMQEFGWEARADSDKLYVPPSIFINHRTYNSYLLFVMLG